MTEIVLDPQAIGWHDDGTDQGHIRVKPVRANLIPIPFRSGNFSVWDQTGSVSVNTTGLDGGNVSNQDQTGSGFFFTIPLGSGASPQAVRLRFRFSGTVLGLRWDQGRAPAYDFCAVIDGVPYRVVNSFVYPDWQTTNVTQDETGVVIAENLPDGDHVCDLVFVHGVANCNYELHGICVEERAGYTKRPQLYMMTTSVLTTSAVAVQTVNNRGCKQIMYYNFSGSPATVTVNWLGTTIWTSTIAAGATDKFDLGNLTATPTGSTTTGLAHLASAGSAIQATPVLGFW